MNSDGTGDYPTIQFAINHAKPGDTIVLNEGTYAGPGNTNLDFRGKPITIRSRNPEDSRCIDNTIIDARGKGVIVRFVNDEGPDSVFEGFTLGAGDLRERVRGNAGFFEFSKNARPATRQLSNMAIAEESAKNVTALQSGTVMLCPGTDSPPAGRVWEGHNPFQQPVNTTNYHGSGDLNLDGVFTPHDLVAMLQMLGGRLPENSRADLDGDGFIGNLDKSLMTQALAGATLPAWWNRLTTRQQRNYWVDRFIALEKTDAYDYNDFFVCHHFAYQNYVHAAFERDDCAVDSTEYDGGQTVYNLPLYHVLVGSPTDHAMNAILVGDDPLNFGDWRFVEPQNDMNVVPGKWNMRFGSTVSIGNRYNNMGDMVTFYIGADGWTLLSFSDDLILTRPAMPPSQYDNRSDAWNPTLLPFGGTGLLFFEKMRADMDRTTDIHVTDLAVANLDSAAAVTHRVHFSRILDAVTGPDGLVHLLFESQSIAGLQNLFYAVYDPVNGVLGDVSQVTEGLRLPAMGRLAITPGGETLAFWFENYGHAGSYQQGIHWTKLTPQGWRGAELLEPNVPMSQTGTWINRQFARYVFDVELLPDGRIIVVCAESEFPHIYLTQFVYNNGVWTKTRIESTAWSYSVQGLDLCRTADGTVHLAYWRSTAPESCHAESEPPKEGRGIVYHRFLDGSSWSPPYMVDFTMQASTVRLAPGPDNTVYMIWERRVNDRVAAVWSRFEYGAWLEGRVLPASPSCDVWYPAITALADGRVYAAWSARNTDWATIETTLIRGVSSDLDLDTQATFLDFCILANAWQTQDGDPRYNPACDISSPQDSIVDILDLYAFCANWLPSNLELSFVADLDADFFVDFSDYSMLAGAWSARPGTPVWDGRFDISYPPDDKIDVADLLMLCSSWLEELAPRPEYVRDDFETGDFSRHNWQQCGQAPWTITSTEVLQGQYAAKSAVIGDGQTSALQIAVSAAGSRISFLRKVSSEANWDFLRFFIDGVEQDSWSGEIGWSQQTFPLSPGQHTLMWSYEKDGSRSYGSDCAWVDNIRTSD